MRKLLIAVVVVVLLLVVADRLAASFVQNRLAERVDQREGVQGSKVDIAGFPFLTQVLANHFDEATVTLPTVDARTRAGSLQVDDVMITLKDIETSNTYTSARAGSVTGSGSIPYSAFDNFGVVEVGYGGEAPDGGGYLDVSVPGLSRSLQIEPGIADGLTLDLGELSRLQQSLPASLRAFLGEPHDFSGLPHGVTIEAIEATPDGLDLTLTGKHVVIAR